MTKNCQNEKLQTRSRDWISRWNDFTQGSQFIQVHTLQTNISNMKFTIIATLFAALATTGFSAAAAIPVATVDEETAPQGVMNDGSENNPRALRGANKQDYSGQSCHLCCENDDC
jgi:hypothetical protein